MSTRILLGTDGGASSEGAVRLACELAARGNQELQVISVLKPPQTSGDAPLNQLREALRAGVRGQLDGVRCQAPGYRLEIVTDVAAPAIVRHAERIDADLIVVGLALHTATERWAHGETTLDVVRLAHVPVLAVPAGATSLPAKAVVAVDFSEFSADAARMVADLLGSDAELHLVHVTWSPPGAGWKTEEIWLETYRIGATARLREFADELASTYGVRVETAILDGKATEEILSYVEATGAGLVAGGSHGYGFLGRLVMGSVARQLLRGSSVTVLITPPRLEAGAAPQGGETRSSDGLSTP